MCIRDRCKYTSENILSRLLYIPKVEKKVEKSHKKSIFDIFTKKAIPSPKANSNQVQLDQSQSYWSMKDENKVLFLNKFQQEHGCNSTSAEFYLRTFGNYEKASQEYLSLIHI
eukprot:TRINITY_DN18157_c0_g2_i2.p1 TRINITY_DN18157_c0_g2~~TRINITY_DN18157_c0_g2_i2.p1  ORF type:complete len:113 (+),score=15.37 TRINITY_DN18157_c0_g2_i2:63-401(+)